ncbi:MAG: beta-galactosidase GalB [Verrucomicrobiota bacterium]|jgi:beta-galactosidase
MFKTPGPLVIIAFVIGLLLPGTLAAQTIPRERISIDDNWRFKKDDPPGSTPALSYDGGWRESDPYAVEEAGDHISATRTNDSIPQTTALKPWILPTGNEFIKEASRRFARPAGNVGENVEYAQPGFDDSAWRQVNLPHDWAIEGPFIRTGGGGMGRLHSPGVGWYRKKLNIPADDAGKRIFLDVDGAMSYAAVWLNGEIVGGWPYGYASWRLDLTQFVRPGEQNTLAIRLDNPPNSSRWYPGGGIYRNVWLVKTSPIHVAHWGTQVTTPEVSAKSATVHLEMTIENDSTQSAEVNVSAQIFSLDSHDHKSRSAVAAIAPVEGQIGAGAKLVAEGDAVIVNPKLWGPPPRQQPNRYVAVTTVWRAGQVADRYETPFGIRTLRFDPDEGLFINGEHILINGVCDHHDLGALGAALNYRALQRQLEMLREMGCNAIRTSHNPPAPELLELTDKMGFLVMDEAFDVWERQKAPLDFHLIFPDWHEQDLRSQLRRDRNSPSVVLWSIGNEVGEQFTGTNGAALAKALCDIVHEEDSTRPATSAMNWAQPTNPFPAALDTIGLNYQGAGIRGAPGKYPAFHERFPDKFIFSSETASALSTRGEYLFPVASGFGEAVGADAGEARAIHQVSGYELYFAAFGASADKVFASQDRPYVGGEFVWTGWDYLGEPTPFDSSRSSYSGIIDLAGFKKDRFYLYQSHWRPDFPMAHILPHWSWPERIGKITPVQVFTSGDEADLFLNGKSLGRKKKGVHEYRLRWDDVVYEPGILKVIAYKNGSKWATDTMKTAGSPSRLELEPDRAEICSDGRDLSFVTVRITDKDGCIAPRANNRIHFDIAGPGEIVATDNGDPTNFEPFQSGDRAAFNGLCLVIIRGKFGQPGHINITAEADGLRSATTSIRTVSQGSLHLLIRESSAPNSLVFTSRK